MLSTNFRYQLLHHFRRLQELAAGHGAAILPNKRENDRDQTFMKENRFAGLVYGEENCPLRSAPSTGNRFDSVLSGSAGMNYGGNNRQQQVRIHVIQFYRLNTSSNAGWHFLVCMETSFFGKIGLCIRFMKLKIF